LGSSSGAFRRAIDDPLHRDSFQTGEMREVRRGVLGMEIKLDGEYSEKEENGEGHPGTDSGPFYHKKKSPASP